MASRVSETVPIWLTLMRMELAHFCSMPCWRRWVLVTKRSSPTSWTVAEDVGDVSFQPAQSSSARPSSMTDDGVLV